VQIAWIKSLDKMPEVCYNGKLDAPADAGASLNKKKEGF
jgi:hypothetical protein